MLEDNKSWAIGEGFTLRVMPKEEFDPLFHKYAILFFDEKSHIFRMREVLSDLEKEKLKELKKHTGSLLELRLGLFNKDQFIGWSYCRQESALTAYMQNSAVFPDFRRKGLYSEMARRVVNICNELGFQTIYSRHSISNNDILIAKLKLGFRITSFELSDVFGVLIHLSLFQNKFRQKVFDYRSGYIRPDDEVKKIMCT